MAFTREPTLPEFLRAAHDLLSKDQRSKLALRQQVDAGFLARTYGELMKKVLRKKEEKTPDRLAAFIVQGLKD
jgi:hypothetical protein